MHELTGYLKLD